MTARRRASDAREIALARSSQSDEDVYRRPSIALAIFIALLSGGASLSFFGVVPELLTSVGGRGAWSLRLEAPSFPAAPAPADAPRAVVDPLAAPPCEGLMLTAVTESPDTNASLASFRQLGAERGVTRAFRGSVGEMRVVYVGENPRRRSPAAWLSKGRELCQVVMRDAPVHRRESVSEAHAKSEAMKRGGGTEPRSRVERLDARSYGVDRSLLDDVMQHPELLGARLDLRSRPTERGLRLARVEPNKLLGQLGFRSGDRIESINGYDLGDPREAVSALARLSRAERLHARVVRDGAGFALDLTLR